MQSCSTPPPIFLSQLESIEWWADNDFHNKTEKVHRCIRANVDPFPKLESMPKTWEKTILDRIVQAINFCCHIPPSDWLLSDKIPPEFQPKYSLSKEEEKRYINWNSIVYGIYQISKRKD